MDSSLSRGKRIALGLTLPCLLLLVVLYMYLGGKGLVCLFYELTGLYCPGCGSGRAVYAAFHGHLREALRYNVLLPLLGIPAGFLVIWEYLRLVFPKLKLRRIDLPRPVILGCTALIFAFWILRNLPAFSFLAPG